MLDPGVGLEVRRGSAVPDDLIHQRSLFNIREEERLSGVDVDPVDTVFGTALAEALDPVFVVPMVRDAIMAVNEVMNRKSKLLEVIRALHPTRRFARCLNGRKQKPDQDANDCDNDEELNERKPLLSTFHS